MKNTARRNRTGKLSGLFPWVCAITAAGIGLPASAQIMLTLPSGTVTPAISWSTTAGQLPAYFTARFPGIGNGYDISSTQMYLAWCAQADGFIGFPAPGPPFTETSVSFTLFNTYPNSALPSPAQSQNWPQVNYILNNKRTHTVSEIQEAIWYFLYGTYYYGDSSVGSGWNQGAQALVDAAIQNGANFVPQPGQIVAVLLYNNSVPLNGTTNLGQDILIELTVPPQGQIGDFVWKDLNQNGIQDAGEPGINGVVVKLCADSACTTVLATTTTSTFKGVDGYYQFTRLSAGTYWVSVDNAQPSLTGLVPTRATQGIAATDSNLNPSMVVLPDSSSQDETIDFGFTPPGTSAIGDFVWQDTNANGLQDAGEPGLSGLTVNLCLDQACTSIIATTTTDQNGNYHFSGLFAGIYFVQVVPGAGFTPTTSQIGYPVNASIDSGGNVSAIPTEVVLPINYTDNTIDFGFVPPAQGAVGDFVWHDLNRNGIQDAGEPGMNNVTVRLFDSANTLVATTTTVTHNGQDGYYQFTGLKAGTYSVVVDSTTLPSGYTPTTTSAPGSSPANDSNGSPAAVTLSTNLSTDQTIDFGFVSPCAGVIGDLVWNDQNHNGIQDTGEPGIPNATVKLYGANHVFLFSTTTDANGIYQFTGRCAATYTVEVDTTTLPAGSTPTLANAPGSAPANDSNGSPATVTLGIDQTDLTIDFGYYQPLVLSCLASGTTGQVGVPFSSSALTVSGGTSPFTFSADTLPAGLTLNTFTGAVTGTPTAAGSFNIRVTDANNFSTTTACPYIIWPAVGASCVAITAVQGLAITPVTMTATGGTGSGYTFSATGLPAGLTMSSTGTISGTPVVSGTFSYTVTITDSAGNKGTSNCSVSVSAPLNLCGLTWGYWKNHVSLWPVTSLVLGSQTYSQSDLTTLLGLPVAGDASINLVHQLIAAKFNVYHGTNPSTDGGAIAAADALLATFIGKLPYNVDPNSAAGSQMTTIAGQLDTFNSDGAGQPGCSAGPTPLTLACAAGTGQVNVSYSSSFAVTGGMAPYTWSLISGALPPGLTLNTSTGALSGTPTTFGVYNFTVMVTDATYSPGSTAGMKTVSCSITIQPGTPTLTVKCPSATATVGVAYSSSVVATGGTAPYTYALYNSVLPPGLTLNASTGAIAGTPTASGSYSFMIYAVDTKMAYGYGTCTIVVGGGIVTGQFTTFTQGGWGAPPKGNNPGAFLTANFTKAYPGGSVAVGGTYKLTFKSALAVTNFLPQGGTPAALKANATNPTSSAAGVFAGQVLALQLSVDFSSKGLLPAGLSMLKATSGPFAGQTVQYILTVANTVLGGGALPSGITISDLNNAVDAINNNFDSGTTNKGYLSR